MRGWRWWWGDQSLVAFNCSSGEVDYSTGLGDRVVSAVTADPHGGVLVASHLAHAASAELGRVDAVSGQYVAMRVMTSSEEAASAGVASGRYVCVVELPVGACVHCGSWA